MKDNLTGERIGERVERLVDAHRRAVVGQKRITFVSIREGGHVAVNVAECVERGGFRRGVRGWEG